LLHYLPGGVFELLLPLWLLVKGFNATPWATKTERASERERHWVNSAPWAEEDRLIQSTSRSSHSSAIGYVTPCWASAQP